ncbi:hypothetical protein PG985_016359 [Apiospora marii]|uniref:uncharacterized protein n=1 Tax=Apiospora marii TaxID=335849 RepID=UPI00312F8485
MSDNNGSDGQKEEQKKEEQKKEEQKEQKEEQKEEQKKEEKQRNHDDTIPIDLWGTTNGPTFLRTANSPLPEHLHDSTQP